MIDGVAQSAQRAIAQVHRCDPKVCPDADTLIALADGGLDPAAREEVAARAAACATCTAALRVALDAKAWADRCADDLEPAPNAHNVHALTSPPRAKRRTWLPMAMAASLTLMVGVGVLTQRSAVEETLRGGASVVTHPVDGALLTEAPARLTWPCAAAPGAARAELLRADATVLWSGDSSNCGATLPPQTRAALVAGEYLWRVQDAADQSLLGPYGFRIGP